MRVMKAFQIQTNYQKHKKRLTSINNFNARNKVCSNTSKNIQFINNYKKQKLTSEIFNERENSHKMYHTNDILQKKMTKLNMRPMPSQKNNQLSVRSIDKDHTGKRLHSKSSLKSLSSEKSRIIKENKKLSDKLVGTKSQYSKFRETTKSVNKNQQHRNQLIRILEGQLGVKPKVTFPKVKKNQENANKTTQMIYGKQTLSKHKNIQRKRSDFSEQMSELAKSQRSHKSINYQNEQCQNKIRRSKKPK